MAKFSISDTLFVTLVHRGTVVFNREICGVCSVAELMRVIRKNVSGCAGMVTMTLRTRTQGWSRTDSLLLSAC